MEFAPAFGRYGFALGRWKAAWRFASPELRRTMSLAQISAAWDAFRRDAGAGAVGPAHEESADTVGLSCTQDPRRDGLLLWLADHGATPIAEAAGLLARMIGATRRFSVEEQELLQAACDALADAGRPGPVARLFPPPDGQPDDALASLRPIAVAVDRLRADLGFVETAGAEVRYRLPGGTLRHYVPAKPGGAWALNLALLASGTTLAGSPPVPGMVSRALFRGDADPDALAATLIEVCSSALEAAYDHMEAFLPELDRGRAALAHLSRNARARDAWLVVAALRLTTRAQLARGLALSRAGADIQARTLADVGLAQLGPDGRIAWRQHRPPSAESARLDDGPLGEAAAELDAIMADIDRLLARTAR